MDKGGPVPPFFDTFDTKYRSENFIDTDSNTNTNVYRHMVAIICFCIQGFKW